MTSRTSSSADAPSAPLAFTRCHAAVPAACFALVILMCMCALEPLCAAASLVGALAYSLVVRGARATLGSLRWQLPMLLLVCVANPFFSASGSTVLMKAGLRSIYLESLAFGACSGALLVATLVWFEGAARVLTQDRLLALAPRRAAALTLLASMAAQLMGELLERSRSVEAASDACTAAGGRPGGARGLVRSSGVLLGWALEDSLVKADSLRARGWERGARRSCYRLERFGRLDALRLIALCALGLAAGACTARICAAWQFYPTMRGGVDWWLYLPFIALMALPATLELVERRGMRAPGAGKLEPARSCQTAAGVRS